MSTCRSAVTNMQSATVRPEVISSFLEAELHAGRVFGPVDLEFANTVQVNRFSLVPKGHQPGKWRLIVDLSSPKGGSVNDGIEPSLCSLHYTSVLLPAPKLDRLRREILRWEGRKSCTKRELLSIIGLLQHSVIKPGRSFLRRMIELSKCVHELHYKVSLNAGFRSDLRWWSCFLPIWNGACPRSSLGHQKPQVTLTSDASGSWGCGAFTSNGEWFQLQWPGSWDGIHITAKELLPIVVGAAVWGSVWEGSTVLCLCDNAAIVAIVNSGRSKMDRAMHLMRCLSFFLARWGISLVCRHISGSLNGAADALSRNAFPSFQRLVPGTSMMPTVIPDNLLQCLVLGTPDWTKVDWIALFGRSL